MISRFDELAKVWFDKARDDLEWAQESFQGERFGGVCFLCQQTAEIALKAYLFSKKEKLVRTHSLQILNEKCKKYNKNFTKLDKAVDVLTSYYTDTRYPDIWDYTRFEDKILAGQALVLAEKIIDLIAQAIK